MVIRLLFIIAGFSTRGSGNVTCDINNHCVGDICQETGCVDGCQNGYYGRFCTNPCSSGCKGNKCTDNGKCTGDCVDGKWGMTCSLHCLNKCKSCNKINGSLCTSCKQFEFGSHCSNSCRGKCPKTGCDMNGTCRDTCSEGAAKDCVQSCGIGCKICNSLTGSCEECHDEFRGSDCEIYCRNCLDACTEEGCVNGCASGYFGKQCHSRCNINCLTETCDHHSGQCLNGCKREYYGSTCGFRCNEHCKNGICNRETGQCSEGCSYGYYGPYCLTRCVHCQEELCHSSSGECIKGCVKGFFGKKCIEPCDPACKSGYCTRFDGACYSPPATPETPITNNHAYYIGGGCVGFLIVFIIGCLLILRWHERLCFRKTRQTTIPGRSDMTDNNSMSEVPIRPNVTHEYYYIDEDGRARSCGSVRAESDRYSQENGQLMEQQPQCRSRPLCLDNAKVYNSGLNEMELHDLPLLDGGSDMCTVGGAHQQGHDGNQFTKTDKLGKYLCPVEGEH